MLPRATNTIIFYQMRPQTVRVASIPNMSCIFIYFPICCSPFIRGVHCTIFISTSYYCIMRQEDSATERYATVCDGCPSWENCESSAVHEDNVRPKCTPAMENTNAPTGTTLETLGIEAGYWRATNKSKEILQCYNDKACLGGKTESLGFCDSGYEGPCEENSGCS